MMDAQIPQKVYLLGDLSCTCGDAYGTRTRVAGVKGRSLNRLTNAPYLSLPFPTQRASLRCVEANDGVAQRNFCPRPSGQKRSVASPVISW